MVIIVQDDKERLELASETVTDVLEDRDEVGIIKV